MDDEQKAAVEAAYALGKVEGIVEGYDRSIRLALAANRGTVNGSTSLALAAHVSTLRQMKSDLEQRVLAVHELRKAKREDGG